MPTKADTVQQLRHLAEKDNFSAVPGSLYSGVHDPVLRAKLNSQFNTTIGQFVAAAQRKATKDEYLKLLASEISHYSREDLDTEDAEQVATNFEKIMDLIGLESSEGILNNWMYESNPTES